MKIQELLEDLVNADISRKKYNGTLQGKDTRYAKSKKQLSNGSQASVKADPNDPHMIKKHNTKVFPEIKKATGYGRPARTNDGFNEYIEYLINHQLTDNIHFPKIYNIKTIIDKDNRKIHSYTMERLIETFELSEDEINAFIEKTVSEDWMGYIEPGKDGLDDVIPLIRKCLDITKRPSDIFIDEEFIKAIDILNKVKSAIHGKDDLSVYNIMWRRTPYGVILVFTDPFF